MLTRLFLATACLVHSTHSFVSPHLTHNVHTRRSAFTVVAGMPDGLAEWGCDATLWDGMPPGSRRDLERFVATDKEEMARNRIETMRRIVEYGEPGAIWEQAQWDKTVAVWEETEAEEREIAKKKAKEVKMAAIRAKSKAAKEAADAAEKEQQHGHGL